MPELFSMLVLAAVQGLTEFLPVSSSGHLVLFQAWLGSREGDIVFDIVLHCGTLGSVLLIYRREIIRLARLDRPALSYLGCLAVGTIPAVVVGLAAKDLIARVFYSPGFAAGGLLVTALVLFSTRLSAQRATELPEEWEPVALPWHQALIVGLAQAMAIMPGISRSGSTIAAALWVGCARAEAARFSFLLSVPAIAGALGLHILGGEVGSATFGPAMLGAALLAFLVGLLALRWTTLAVVQAHFWKFGFYCLSLGLLVLVLLR